MQGPSGSSSSSGVHGESHCVRMNTCCVLEMKCGKIGDTKMFVKMAQLVVGRCQTVDQRDHLVTQIHIKGQLFGLHPDRWQLL